MSKYLKHDDEVRSFRTREALEDYLQFRKEHDQWFIVRICETGVVGIENFPMTVSEECSKNSLNALDESVYECIEDGNGLFLTFPVNGKQEIYPTRLIAFTSICLRAGLSGYTISNFQSSKLRKVLPIIEKASWLSRGLSLNGAYSKILLRDEKVSAMLSEDYVVLPADELIAALEKELRKEHENLKFLFGEVSHEYLHVRYSLDDEDTDDRFSNLLQNIRYLNTDATDTSVKCGIGFATSDVGLSSAYAYPYFSISGLNVRFGETISMRHDGKNSVEKFAEKLQNLAGLFKEAEDAIEHLGNTDLTNVATVVRNVVDKYSFLPKKQAEEVIKELEANADPSGTAMDAYLALNDIVDRYSQECSSPTVHLNMLDKVCQFLRINYQLFE